MSKPLIVVTNDDGINFIGIKKLKEAMEPLGDVFVIAPDAERSAVGHAITLATPLRVNEVYNDDQLFGYSVNGTPADCIKLAVAQLLPRRPDIIVSGINPGENTAYNVLYSGTVSAATEGIIHGIPSIAFSIASFKYRNFDVAMSFATELAQEVLEKGLNEGTLLNVNIPPLPAKDIKGVKIARHGKGRYKEDFEQRLDPSGRNYYWLSGKRQVPETIPDADDVMVTEGYIVVSPIKFELTDEESMIELNNWRITGYNEN